MLKNKLTNRIFVGVAIATIMVFVRQILYRFT